MSYRKWREEFLFQFASEFPTARLSAALSLLKAATAEQRNNEAECSFEMDEAETVRREKRSLARNRRVAEQLKELGAMLAYNGDPRGCAYTIKCASGREIPIPGNGYPPSAFR